MEKRSKHAFVKRWKHEELFKKGYVPLPVLFLHHYAEMKPFPLTSGEALFVLHLMEFKWDEQNPFPGYKTLAKRMGVSPKMARRHAQSLQQKHYLNRELRVAQTNRFDLNPLFDCSTHFSKRPFQNQPFQRKRKADDLLPRHPPRTQSSSRRAGDRRQGPNRDSLGRKSLLNNHPHARGE